MDAITTAKVKSADDPSYAPFLASVATTFAERTAIAKVLFSVDTDSLWETYLAAFPAEERQVYVCSACKQFVQRFGGLVVIAEETGHRVSAVWNPEANDGMFVAVAEAMRQAVERLSVSSAFIAPAGTLGTPLTGEWTHIHAVLPQKLARTDRLLTANQIGTAIRENVATVERALDEFPLTAVAEALRVLEADALSRAEKFIGPVRWLHNLHIARGGAKDERKRAAVIWQAVATSPEGYSHPRASVVGPLLEGIIAGKSFETLRAEFAAMLHPLRYQRPQAAPSAGNIAEAERIVAQLGIAPSLERRFARLDECETIWVPAVQREAPKAGGVFAHLAPKEPAAHGLQLPAQTMTWDKFQRTVLPTATAIDMRVPSTGSFMALTAATNDDAPPIIRWDRDDKRNSVSWYLYNGGSLAAQWGLTGNSWCPLTAVVPLPNLWGSAPSPQHGEGFILMLSGAVDTRDAGLALFPEHLREDLRAIRSTIEAFSGRGTISGREQASASGYDMRKGDKNIGVRLRVTVAGKSSEFVIDRWD